MTNNVENWTYKSKAEIEALDDKTLVQVQKELSEAFKMFGQHKVAATDEMVWQLMVVPGVVASRGLTVLCND